MSESNVVAMMKQAVELYQLGQVAVEKLQLDPATAYYSAYGVLRRLISDHLGQIEVRFSDDPAKQGWRRLIMAPEVPEFIFSVEGLAGKFEIPCPVTLLDEWGYLHLLRKRLMGDYNGDVIAQLQQFREHGTTLDQRQLAHDSLTLLKYSCGEILPVLYSLPGPPHNLYFVSPDQSMLPENHWSNDGLTVVFAGFLPGHLLDINLEGGGTLKSWVVALRPLKYDLS